jgi:hypothetical protein
LCFVCAPFALSISHKFMTTERLLDPQEGSEREQEKHFLCIHEWSEGGEGGQEEEAREMCMLHAVCDIDSFY